MSRVPDYRRMGELEFLICFHETFSEISKMVLKIPKCSEQEKNFLFGGKELIEALYEELLCRYAK